jgi:hypothetical protein
VLANPMAKGTTDAMDAIRFFLAWAGVDGLADPDLWLRI